MMKFRVLIPAAGYSRRFAEAGHQTLKPDLVIEHAGSQKRMIDWVLSALPHPIIGPVIFGAHPKLDGPARPVVRINIHSSRGQAHTLLNMLRATCKGDFPLLIVNSDVVFQQNDLASACRQVIEGADSGVLVYKSDNPEMSYVNAVPYATDFAEKRQISAFAVAGAWAFRSSQHLYDGLKDACMNMREPYLSHAMNKMGGVHACHLIEARDVLDWGTPEAVKASGARIVE